MICISEYIDGMIIPDSFIKKYTKFSTFLEFKKMAAKYGILIYKKSYKIKSPDEKFEKEKEFCKNYTSFSSIEKLYEVADVECAKAPSITRKMYLSEEAIKNKLAMSGTVTPYTLECICPNCKEEVIIPKEEIIPRCKCGWNLFSIKKVF